ncbi:MAG TPA: S-ribosylhomocysteine lyase [Eubacteriales bacterium]|jgi:S-ribosylhomocysteine lyase|nr:S-ribosylhomocysteine lyase [Clostridia bacterium]HRR90061.1 S-ribosylhomocysteine lyase [Eubacteriales bacterium]HRU84087.1 S-ribosylhomocysteine lyase [Eubacteriales bacterium]
MEAINSFKLDHNVLDVGFYLEDVSNNVYTYDLRFKKPNGGDYLSNPAMHTIEHIFAVVIRNGRLKDKVVYFGPMGCRTGFYLLFYGVDREEARAETIFALKECLKLDYVPGSKKIECGNYKSHSLKVAKAEIERYLKAIDRG